MGAGGGVFKSVSKMIKNDQKWHIFCAKWHFIAKNRVVSSLWGIDYQKVSIKSASKHLF